MTMTMKWWYVLLEIYENDRAMKNKLQANIWETKLYILLANRYV